MVIRLFEFRDFTPIEAFVLATDEHGATERFKEYVIANGGDPDSLLWRELTREHLEDDFQSAVREAMEMNREGLVIRDEMDRWVFITPLGDAGSTLMDS